MLTPRDYIERSPRHPNEELWVHGLDLLHHCMQVDPEQSWFKDKHPNKKFAHEVQEELEKHAVVEKANLNKVLEDGLRKQTKWTRFDDYQGDLDLDQWLANPKGETPVFNNFKKEKKYRPSMNILMDIGIAYGDRQSNHMIERHRQIYELTVQAWDEGRPCRVIAAVNINVIEQPRNLMIFCVIKDFSDPIFPGIWGAFKTNLGTNSFLNCIMDYWIGTHTLGNGTIVPWSASKYFQPNEVQIVDARNIRP